MVLREREIPDLSPQFLYTLNKVSGSWQLFCCNGMLTFLLTLSLLTPRPNFDLDVVCVYPQSGSYTTLHLLISVLQNYPV